MTIKSLLKSYGAVSLLALGTACSDDDQVWPIVDGGSPQINLAMNRIRTDYDLTFRIKGKITDADGIASIRLEAPGLSLDKTIDIIGIYEEPLKEYDLDYSYTAKENYVTDFSGSYPVKVTVTDVAGKTETQEVLVTFDADFDPPVFTQAPDKQVTVLIKNQTLFNLKFTVEDNRNIDYVEVDLEGVEGYPMRIEGNGDTRVVYAQKLELPSVEKEYKLTITAKDFPAQDNEVRTTVVESNIKVQVLPDFDRVYLADVETADELNSDVFGVPMVCDHVGPFQYRARYYNEKAGTKICFIPQKTDFYPICFGPNPENESILGDDPETSGRITLDQSGVYYKIDFNTKTGAYNVSTYTIDEAIDPIQNLHYGQNDLNTWNDWKAADPWWQEWYFGPTYSNPKEIQVRMNQDPANPHIWISDDWELSSGEMNEWILHNWHHDGWWNWTSWRFDDSTDPSKCEYYGYLFPDNDHFNSNRAFFEWKYVNVNKDEYNFMHPGCDTFNPDTWGMINEGYAKTFVPDVKAKPVVITAGKYRIWFDAHTERIKLIPAK